MGASASAQNERFVQYTLSELQTMAHERCEVQVEQANAPAGAERKKQRERCMIKQGFNPGFDPQKTDQDAPMVFHMGVSDQFLDDQENFVLAILPDNANVQRLIESGMEPSEFIEGEGTNISFMNDFDPAMMSDEEFTGDEGSGVVREGQAINQSENDSFISSDVINEPIIERAPDMSLQTDAPPRRGLFVPSDRRDNSSSGPIFIQP